MPHLSSSADHRETDVASSMTADGVNDDNRDINPKRRGVIMALHSS
jgi:hypothetical protein